ncbi:FG-GAP repeat domain-containing protein [Actinacidiphila rubida]|uniref:FG-GAP repeat domain-containing protein n=1 Tax=Actinacidiphila rubida TaxID=310780 RepID=UPI0008499D18|nr:VCBS repeat-containing protein [Actinacidiphila rubida]
MTLAIGLIGAVIGFTPVQSAVADGTPAPSISVATTHDLDLYGPAQELDVTVDSPPTTDAYARLEILGQQTGLHITDGSGTELPLTVGTGRWQTNYLEVKIGQQDSDGNGIPGAPMTAGTIRLHVRADYPVSETVGIRGILVDGATGNEITESPGPIVTQYVYGRATVTGSAKTAVTTGFARSVRAFKTGFHSAGTTPVPPTHTTLTFTAAQLVAAGYTAAQLADSVQLSLATGTNPGPFAPLAWTHNTDGSLSITLPTIDWSTVQNTGLNDQDLGIQAKWGLPAGKLIGTAQVLDDQGHTYASWATEEFDFTADIRPATLQAAFYGIDTGGRLWQYCGQVWTAQPSYYEQRTSVGGGWNTYSAITALSPLKANGTGDMVARDRTGVLWYYAGTGTLARPFDPRIRIGAGWNMYNQLTGAGDLTGDGHADLLARDTTGVLWLYKGTGKPSAPFAARIRIGAGWNSYNLLTQAGDITGDGHPDLLARDTTGALWLYQGTGNATAPYAARVRIGTGWGTYTHIVGIGDLLVDGHPDIIATDKTGQLWYYAGTGNTATPYKPRAAAGTGWGIYTNLL